jgi:hypothetical protein
MLTHDSISNFIGGVSQQPNKLMFPNQAKELINMFPDPSVGLKRRYPTEHVARIRNTLSKHPKVHTVVKENEQYQILLAGDGTVAVYDMEGNAKTVNGVSSSNSGYITTNTPLTTLDVVTIGDYNFILNKSVTTAMNSAIYSSTYGSRALVFVKQGDYAIDYKVIINGNTVATKTTSKTDIADCKTDAIAEDLKDQIVTSLGSGWTIARANSTIFISKDDGSSFTIRTSDSNGDRNLFSFYKVTDDLTNLPVVARNNFIIKVVGEDVNKSDDYYVRFRTADGSTYGTGSWIECPAPTQKYQVDADTMPHAIVRNSNGTFTYKTLSWTGRRAGDEDSCKTPSFIGKKIQEIFTHKGRIAFISADNTIYSDTENVFAFFKKTALASLDTDPIDISSNSKMVDLKHSLPFNNDLLLFSNQAQFTVTCGDIFSNSTVAIDLTMEYPCSSLCKPANIGGTALFVYDNGAYSGVYEAYIASTYNTAARSVTEQIPSYIPKNVYKIAPSALHNISLLSTLQDKTKLYVYNAYYSSEQKAQSAWSMWQFEDRQIIDVSFIENYLYFLVQYSDGIYLERMNFSAKQKENNNLNYIYYLDRKVTLSSGGTYDSSTDTTSYTIPYVVNDGTKYRAITSKGFLKSFTITASTTTSTLAVKGNTTEDTITFGKIFTSYWKFGTIYKRQQTQTGASQVTEGLLMLKDINLSYTDSCYFKARIIPHFTSQITSEYEYTGILTGTDSAQLGIRNSYSGVFMIPVQAKNDEIEIEIVNDSYLPSTFLALEWLGDLCIRGNNN